MKDYYERQEVSEKLSSYLSNLSDIESKFPEVLENLKQIDGDDDKLAAFVSLLQNTYWLKEDFKEPLDDLAKKEENQTWQDVQSDLDLSMKDFRDNYQVYKEMLRHIQSFSTEDEELNIKLRKAIYSHMALDAKNDNEDQKFFVSLERLYLLEGKESFKEAMRLSDQIDPEILFAFDHPELSGLTNTSDVEMTMDKIDQFARMSKSELDEMMDLEGNPLDPDPDREGSTDDTAEAEEFLMDEDESDWDFDDEDDWYDPQEEYTEGVGWWDDIEEEYYEKYNGIPDELLAIFDKIPLVKKKNPKARKSYSEEQFYKDMGTGDQKWMMFRMLASIGRLSDAVVSQEETPDYAAKTLEKLFSLGYADCYMFDAREPLYFLSPLGQKAADENPELCLKSETINEQDIPDVFTEKTVEKNNAAAMMVEARYTETGAAKVLSTDRSVPIVEERHLKVLETEQFGPVQILPVPGISCDDFVNVYGQIKAPAAQSVRTAMCIGFSQKHTEAFARWVQENGPQYEKILYTWYKNPVITELESGQTWTETVNVSRSVHDDIRHKDYGTPLVNTATVREEVSIEFVPGPAPKKKKPAKKKTAASSKKSNAVPSEPKEQPVQSAGTHDPEPESTPEPEPVQEPEILPEPVREELSEPVDTEIIEPEKEPVLTSSDQLSQAQTEHKMEIINKMLADGKDWAAMAYLHILSDQSPVFEKLKNRLALAVHDPASRLDYSSSHLFEVFDTYQEDGDDILYTTAFLISAFNDSEYRDYSLEDLFRQINDLPLVKEAPGLQKVIHTVFDFKNKTHRGLDTYADYRHKDRSEQHKFLDEARAEVRTLYESYISDHIKENTANTRLYNMKKLLYGSHGELAEVCRWIVDESEDSKDNLDMARDFVKETFIRDGHSIAPENIDEKKILKYIDGYWQKAVKGVLSIQKSQDLKGNARNNTISRLNSFASAFARYFQASSQETSAAEDHTALYGSARKSLLKDIPEAANDLFGRTNPQMNVLIDLLNSIHIKLEGTWKNTDFYAPFLESGYVLLRDDMIPDLSTDLDFPGFSIEERIIKAAECEPVDLRQRAQDILMGEDDFGTLRIIEKNLEPDDPIRKQIREYGEQSLAQAEEQASEIKTGFVNYLELAQYCGRLDESQSDAKENFRTMMELMFQNAHENHNYGYFRKGVEALEAEIDRLANEKHVSLEKTLEELQQLDVNKNNPLFDQAAEHVRTSLEAKNYSAAEDLLNRIAANDLEFGDVELPEELDQFLGEYHDLYQKVSRADLSLKKLLGGPSSYSKTLKNGQKIIDCWPSNFKIQPEILVSLLRQFGFDVLSARRIKDQNNFSVYEIVMNEDWNTASHPVAAYGSLLGKNGMSVIVYSGNADARQIMSVISSLNLSNSAIFLLDAALPEPERRALARLMKKDAAPNPAIVIDRVAAYWLARHYRKSGMDEQVMAITLPFAWEQPYVKSATDPIPPEMFIGRKKELQEILSETQGVNLVYGGRQLGKSALLWRAKEEVESRKNGSIAVYVDLKDKNYKESALELSRALAAAKVFDKDSKTESWDELGDLIRNALQDKKETMPHLLILMDEADALIDSSSEINYKPFGILRSLQKEEGGFKFVAAGLRDVVRFSKKASQNNSLLPQLRAMTVKPFKSAEARELLEVPLAYLGFQFPENGEGETMISNILGRTNYFPGLIQLFASRLLEATNKNYAGYEEQKTPPYIITDKQFTYALSRDNALNDEIKRKFIITLQVDQDDYYMILALLIAYCIHNGSQSVSLDEIISLASDLRISRITDLKKDQVRRLLEEMQELNVLKESQKDHYRFTRWNFLDMLGDARTVEESLMEYLA